MPATITLQFDDEASPGFEKLVKNISAGGDASSELQAELEKLRAELDDVRKANEHVAESQSAVKSEVQQTQVVVQESSRTWESTLVTLEFVARNVYGLAKSYAEFRVATQGVQVAQSVVSAAIRSSIGYATGLGTAVTGTYLAYRGMNEILERTGRRLIDVESLGSDVSQEFVEMQQQARNLGISVEEHIGNAGKTLEDYGVKVQTNADRINAAFGRLGKEAARPFSEIGSYIHEWWESSNVFLDAWKELDQQVTYGSDNMVENLGMISQGIRWMNSVLLNPSAERAAVYRKEIELLEDQARTTEFLAKLNADNRDDYARVRAINDEVERSLRARKEEIRYREMNLEKVREEIQRLKEVAGQFAQNDSNDEETYKDIENRRVQLAKREQELIEETAAKRKESLLKTYADQQRQAEESDRREREMVHDRIREQNSAYEQSRRAEQQAAEQRSRDQAEELREFLQAENRKREEQKRTADEQSRAYQQRVRDMAGKFSSGMSGADVRQQSVDLEMKTLDQIGQLRQKAVQSFVTGDVRGFFEARQQEYQLLQQSLQQQKQLREKFAKEGNLVDQMKSQFGGKDVLNQVAENRFQDAGKGLLERNQAAADAYRRQRSGGTLTGDEQRMVKQLEREAEKLRSDIMRQVNRDARAGKIGEEEANRATNSLVNSTVKNMEQSGKFSREVTDGLRAATDNTQKTTEAIQQQSELIKQVQEQANRTSEQLDEILNNNNSNGIARARRGAR